MTLWGGLDRAWSDDGCVKDVVSAGGPEMWHLAAFGSVRTAEMGWTDREEVNFRIWCPMQEKRRSLKRLALRETWMRGRYPAAAAIDHPKGNFCGNGDVMRTREEKEISLVVKEPKEL
jgi:hypothetical protein